MKKYLSIVLVLLSFNIYAGNSDRLGEAGAPELIMNGWARSTGVWDLNTSRVMGIGAMKLNPAGLSFVKKMDVALSYTQWWAGSEVALYQLGFASKLGADNVVGVTIMSLDPGNIERTTVDNPDPDNSLGSFRPSYFNIGLTFSRNFSSRIHGGLTLRLISESAESVSTFGFAIDAGIQYVLGAKDNIRFGVSVRNLGTPMKFSGDGFSFRGNTPDADNYTIAVKPESAPFQLPSLLTLGASYDLWLGSEYLCNGGFNMHRVTILGSYISNSMGKDNFGLGLEYGFKEMFMARIGYRYEDGIFNPDEATSFNSGLAAGFSVDIPFQTGGPSLGLDYSYRHTTTLAGTHSVGLNFKFGDKGNNPCLSTKEKDATEKDAFKKEKVVDKIEKEEKKEKVEKKKKKKVKEEPKVEVLVQDTVIVVKEAVLVDSDSDGLPDKYDLCPNEKGELRYGGCKAPEVKKETLNKEEEATIKAVSSKIAFENNSFELTKNSIPELDKLVKILKDKPNSILRIDAHTDSKGSDDYNLLLSYKRGKEVKSKLISKGIPEENVVFEIHGENEPVDSNETPEGRANNRRVEISIR